MPYYLHHMGHWHRGPSRILWFFIGAASASWWILNKDPHRRNWGHCRRPSIQPPTLPVQPPESTAQSPESWSARDIPRAINNIAPGSWDWNARPNRQWEDEKIRMASMSRQAADTVTDLSETTLDSILSATQALKDKLAEHRAEREKQHKLYEQQVEEQKRNPPHVV